MFKSVAIILGSIVVLGLIASALFFYLSGSTSSKLVNNLLLQTAYLNKSKESYARCYNSINHGSSLIGDVRLQIKAENFNNDLITGDRLDVIERSFMDLVKLKCQKIIDGYHLAYDKAAKNQDEIDDSSNALRTLLFGSASSQSSVQNINSLEPALVRMAVAFNEYIFTEQEVKDYFEKELSL